MIRWIYKLYRQQFLDLMVEEFYGNIPDELKEPSLDFLANGKDKLEKFFQIHAYHLQRRAVADLKHADIYQGMLIEVKALLSAIAKARGPKEHVKLKREKNPADYEKDIEDFIEKGKKRTQAAAE